ncbi:NUDIX domain-containing protein [Mycoplasmatota bacterium WC44]
MERFKLTPAVFLLLIREGCVLLLKRKNTGYMDGFYSLVAGHLDGNETVKAGMIREAKEEANILIKEDDLDVSLVMHRFSSDERIDFFLTAKDYEGVLKNNEPDKCEKLEWFELDELPNNIVPNVKKAIENYLKGLTFDEFDDRNFV